MAQAPADAHYTATPSALPGFVWSTRVFFDDLDAMGMLHNSRYAVLAERANSAFFEAHGWRYESDPARNPDQFYVVREQWVRHHEPVVGPCDVEVEMWVEHLGRSSATYGFEVRAPGGFPVFARLRRAQVKLDPVTLRPASWTPLLRSRLEAILRADAT